ncbi:hypothetical protein KV557_29270 [Kitasatospora aureofaciens]|uniref:hypothetical protein n=1 Tax=Kitasatospora aureofaciens TaxID=1894 RepID=UPI001C45395D|nr:hypothetical protein [Kitasatospora aureofaciens]MBV6701152.1 hypothetical protein [Kitasatospora aureofaciens]
MTDQQRTGRPRRRPVSNLRSAAGAALLAATLAGLAGCSGGSGAGSSDQSVHDQLAADPLTAVRNAADITGRTGSAHTATELVTESSEKKASFTGTGGYDYVKRIGRLEIAVPPGAATTGKIVEVVLPGTVYLQNSGAKVPEGKWVKLDVRQLPDGNLVSSGATDPATAAGALRGVQKADAVGTETVDGVALHHYRGTLDLAKAADATGGRGGDGLRTGSQTFTVKEVPYDAWLDDQGRLHKVVEIFTFAGVAGSKEAKDQVKVTSTTALTDFGKPVEAAEPPASDIFALKPTESPK